MKKILSTALAIVLFVGASQAQTTDNNDHQHKGHRQEMGMNNLNLTADQKAKLQAIREAQKSEMETLKKNGTVTAEQRKALHEKYRSQFQSVLTPAQQEQMQKQREEWKDKAQDGKSFGKDGKAFGYRGDMGGQAAFLKKELNLTANQEAKLKGIFEEFRTKAQSLRSNSSLSQEQRKEQMKSLMQQYMSQGKSVLTPEQAKKFDEMKSKRQNRRNSNV